MGGYFYYEEEKTGKPENRTKPISLKVEQGETLSNIHFRFADFKKGTWRKYAHSDGLPCMTVYRIYRDPDGVMWFGTVGGGVSRYDGKNFVSFTTRDGLADNVVWAIHRDPDGVMWFGTRSGVSRYDGKGFISFSIEDGLVSYEAGGGIWSIHQDHDGILWFGGDGVSRYDGRGFVNFTAEDGMTGVPDHAIHRDPDGVMWFATFTSGLFCYDGADFVNFTTADGLAGDDARAIHADPNGTIWIASFGWGKNIAWIGGGVSRYDGKELVSFAGEEGLPNTWLNAVYCDSDGLIWLAGRHFLL